MKNLARLISSTAILPSLLLSATVDVHSGFASPLASGVTVLAQNAPPSEEEKLRRLEQEKKHQQQPAEQHPAGQQPGGQHQPPQQPQVQHSAPPPAQVSPPVAPHQVTPPVVQTPVRPVAPAPAPSHPAPATPPETPHHPAPAQGQTPPAGAPAHPATVPNEPAPQHTTPAGEPHHSGPAAPQPVTPQPVAPQPVAPQPVAPRAVQPQSSQPQSSQPPAGQNQSPAGPHSAVPPAGPHPAFNPSSPQSTMAPQYPAQQQPQRGNQPARNGMTPLQGVAVGAAVGVVGGMIIGSQVHRLDEVQSSRQVVEQNGATFYGEPGRVIVREGDGLYVRHDETERFREFGTDVRVEQRGDETIQTVNRPDGSRIITITDANGELLKRLRRLPNGQEIILIDNTFRPRPRHFTDEVVIVDPPTIDIPPDRYEIDASRSDEDQIYDTLIAPPVAHLQRRYTLDEVRNSRDLRRYVRSVDLTTITFETASWTIADGDIGRLQGVADAINRAVRANPNEIFLIEGHTDAVGNDVDNLSLSDRRAQSVASLLTRSFNVPPENLITQGYGSQFLKVQTDGAERANRRVTVRRVTPFLTGGTQR